MVGRCLLGRGWSFARFVYVDRGFGCPRNKLHVIHIRFYLAPDASSVEGHGSREILVIRIIFILLANAVGPRYNDSNQTAEFARYNRGFAISNSLQMELKRSLNTFVWLISTILNHEEGCAYLFQAELNCYSSLPCSFSYK